MPTPQKTEIKHKGTENLIPYKPGQSGNLRGRGIETPEERQKKKIVRLATKEFIQNYTRDLTEALPKISPVLIAQALRGNLIAIKEINDRVLGKPKESLDLTSGGQSLIRPTPEQEIKALKALKDIE